MANYRRINIVDDFELVMENFGDRIVEKFSKNIRRVPPQKLPNSNYVETKCWLWLGSIQASSGYGLFYTADGSTELMVREVAHRMSYAFHNGVAIPQDHQIIHKCDNVLCCNPDHLELANSKKNGEDKCNRYYTPKPFNKTYKLSRFHKHAIRILWNQTGNHFTAKILADMFNVSPVTIYDIINKKIGKFTDDIGIENPDMRKRHGCWSDEELEILKNFIKNRKPYERYNNIYEMLPNKKPTNVRNMVCRLTHKK